MDCTLCWNVLYLYVSILSRHLHTFRRKSFTLLYSARYNNIYIIIIVYATWDPIGFLCRSFPLILVIPSSFVHRPLGRFVPSSFRSFHPFVLTRLHRISRSIAHGDVFAAAGTRREIDFPQDYPSMYIWVFYIYIFIYILYQ